MRLNSSLKIRQPRHGVRYRLQRKLMQSIHATHRVKNVHKLNGVKRSPTKSFQLPLIKPDKVRSCRDVTFCWKCKREEFNHVMLWCMNCRHFPVIDAGESACVVVYAKGFVPIVFICLLLANTHVSWSEIIVDQGLRKRFDNFPQLI